MNRPISLAARALAAASLLCACATTAIAAKPPNVVIFLADDLGWSDVGYHGGGRDRDPVDRPLAA